VKREAAFSSHLTLACRALRKARAGVGELRRTVAFKSGAASRTRDFELAPRDADGADARAVAVADRPIQKSGSRRSRLLVRTKGSHAVGADVVTAYREEELSDPSARDGRLSGKGVVSTEAAWAAPFTREHKRAVTDGRAQSTSDGANGG
jgi:hypothetical protein